MEERIDVVFAREFVESLTLEELERFKLLLRENSARSADIVLNSDIVTSGG